VTATAPSPSFKEHPRAGLAAVLLALGFPQWISRRVEQAAYLDDSTVRWRVSVTFVLPEPEFFGAGISPTLSTGSKIYVPLVLLSKRPLTHFHARNEDDRSLPVLATAQNGRLAAAGMSALIWGLAEQRLNRELSDHTLKVIDAVVTAPTVTANPIVQSALNEGELAEVLSEEDIYRTLMYELSSSFMLMVPLVYEPGRERVIKYAYTAPLPWKRGIRATAAAFGLADFRADLDVLALGASASYHIEIEAPPDVRLAAATVVGQYMDRERGKRFPVALDIDGDSPRVNLHAARPSERVLKLASETAPYKEVRRPRRWCKPKPRAAPESSDRVKAAAEALPTLVEADDRGLANVLFRNELSGTFIAAVLVSGLTCLLLWGARTRLLDLDGQTGAEILLALPILAAGYLTRPGEHAFATRLLLGIRFLALLVGVCALLVAALLGAGVTQAASTTAPQYRCVSQPGSGTHGHRQNAAPGLSICSSTSVRPSPKHLKSHVQVIANWAAYVATGATGLLLMGFLRSWWWPCRRRPK
jgi:hypothetical protein